MGPRRKRPLRSIVLGVLLVAPSLCGSDRPMTRVNRGMLCITEGTLEDAPSGRFAVNVAKMRAYVNRYTLQSVEAQFKYLGPTADEKALGSGEMRRQFGLKLRSQDPCNLVYAMWRIEPKSELVVSVKTNPGQHTSADCTNHGYRDIRPVRKAPIPSLRPGDAHSIRAVINGENLRVFVDEHAVWEGSVGSDALKLNGPVGIRSDNARLDFQLSVGELAGAHPDFVIACKSGPGEPE